MADDVRPVVVEQLTDSPSVELLDTRAVDGRPPYVEPAELAELLGEDTADPRLERVCEAASRVIDSYYGARTVEARLAYPWVDPITGWPEQVVEAALTIAGDLWRRPTAPGGYFQVADYTGRLALDPASPVAVLLDSVGRLDWPFA